MKIHADFVGGNIRVLQTEKTDVYVQNEIRDTMEDWFYWAFCVEGAQGKTLTFHFDKKWIGYFGPAVSHDLRTWHWLGAPDASVASDSFTYSFAQEETRVYFAHNMLYHPAQFEAFCQANGLKSERLCVSEAGRDVPYVRTGAGDALILLAARHHACESTGSYVLEGALEELHNNPIPGLQAVAVPFVDYDGVVQGDQGKSRAPWDHNRDYVPGKESIYASVRAIRALVAREKPRYAFDFHSPWHLGNQNDWVFIPQKHYDTLKFVTRFANLFEKSITAESLPYFASGTMPPDTDWNTAGTPCFGSYMHENAGAEFSFTLETPYFKALDCPYSADRAREMGRCFARALRRYHARHVKISFTGDLLYQNPMNDLCRAGQGYDYLPLLKRVWTRLPDTDYLVGNLETPVAGEALGGYTNERYCFNTPKAALDALKKTGFDLLSLANNHCMDRGQAGVAATLDACERAGMEHIGLYRTPEESEVPFVREINGIRVGFVNATYGTNAFAHHHFLDMDKAHMVKLTQPEETREGSIHLLHSPDEIAMQVQALYDPDATIVAPYLERLKADVQNVRERSEFVVMLLHSGGQYNTLPDAYTRMLAERLWTYGVDIIIGNHPHIILPSTCDNGRFTAYCLGNLMSAVPGASIDCVVNPDFSAIVNLTLERRADKIVHHVTFRLFQLLFDAEMKTAPQSVDTYDQWLANPSAEYRQTVLHHANLFMPGMHYTEPMAEYPVC